MLRRRLEATMNVTGHDMVLVAGLHNDIATVGLCKTQVDSTPVPNLAAFTHAHACSRTSTMFVAVAPNARPLVIIALRTLALLLSRPGLFLLSGLAPVILQSPLIWSRRLRTRRGRRTRLLVRIHILRYGWKT